MAGFVNFLRSVAAGVERFKAVRTGEESEVDSEGFEHSTFGLADGRLEVVNPFLAEQQAIQVERVSRGMIDAYGAVVTRWAGLVFKEARDLGIATLAVTMDEETPDGLLDRGWLFELARIAHYLFADDTKPERMFACDVQLTYILGGVTADFSSHVRAFFDAAFTGDLERAVRVGDAVAAAGVEAFKKPTDDREVVERLSRRTFAGMILMEMAGTLFSQIRPDLVKDLDERPIGGAVLADPWDGEISG